MDLWDSNSRREMNKEGKSATIDNKKETTMSVDDTQELLKRIYDLKGENANLNKDIIALARLNSEVFAKYAGLTKRVQLDLARNDARLQEYLAPIVKELQTVNTKLEDGMETIEERIDQKIEKIYGDIEEAGKKYSNGFSMNLKMAADHYRYVMKQGAEFLQAWNWITKGLLVVLALVWGYNLYQIYQYSSELNRVEMEIHQLRQVYQGKLKYWYDGANQQLWLENQETHNKR